MEEPSHGTTTTCADDFIYEKPIHIPEDKTDPNDLMIPVAIAFNLALSYHLLSRRVASLGFDSSQLRNQALQIYQYSFRMQRLRKAASQASLFYMATINNIGVLFDKVGESKKAEECFQQLLGLLMYLSVSTKDKSDNSKFEAFFFFFTKRLSHPQCAVGAGAA